MLCIAGMVAACGKSPPAAGVPRAAPPSASATPVASGSLALVSLEIRDEWRGLGIDVPDTATWRVTREGDGYRMRGTAGISYKHEVTTRVDAPVPVARVEALATALRAPLLESVDLAAVNIDAGRMQAWLDGKEAELLPRATTDDFRQRIRAWRDGFRNPAVLRAAVSRGFPGFAIDDQPFVTVSATFADGRRVSYRSTSGMQWLLPWENADKLPTFDTALPVAVGNLLPEGSPNRSRFMDMAKPPGGDSYIASGVREELGALRAEAEAPEAVADLRTAFRLDNLIAFANPPDAFLRADLRAKDTTGKFALGVRIPLHSGRIDPADMAEVGRRWATMTASDALQRAAGKSEVRVFRAFYTPTERPGASDGDEIADRALFVEQMHAMGKLKNVQPDSPLLAHAFVVMEGHKRAWMILADGRSVLWQAFTAPGGRARSCAVLPSESQAISPPTAWCVGDGA
ncbi:hypothetical protein KPL74_11335 [Bacillus sp. NP157]|nr:hypothetical protein KPL74_11335 [Bacillus sp. NP157]